ncbi:MAG: hypothetical protein KY467_14300 [Gemmatimonadetes bacterium]|nr:hypothetical protein [Gemmatimonadota bacterium]
MRKLKLELEALAVQSFATNAVRGPRGTAHAHADTAIAGDTAYAVDTMMEADTMVQGDTVAVEDTQADPCFTCELSCGTRGC